MKEIVNIDQLSKILGIGKRRIHGLAKEKVIHRVGHGKYDLAVCISRYMEYRSQVNKKETAIIRDLRTQMFLIQTERLKIDMDFRAGTLIRKAGFVKATQDAIAIARSRLLGLPTNMASKVIGLRSRKKIKQIFQEAISGILDELDETFNEKLKDLISENK